MAAASRTGSAWVHEVTEAVCAVLGGGRVGIRLSPLSPFNDVDDADPQAVFTAAVAGLAPFGLAYLHLIEGVTGGPREPANGFDLQLLHRAFSGAYMANNGFDGTLAEQTLATGRADLIAFGRPYIANPDLVERLRGGAPLAALDKDTLYGGGEHGYTDYPKLKS